jgi:hypothetical protein
MFHLEHGGKALNCGVEATGSTGPVFCDGDLRRVGLWQQYRLSKTLSIYEGRLDLDAALSRSDRGPRVSPTISSPAILWLG